MIRSRRRAAVTASFTVTLSFVAACVPQPISRVTPGPTATGPTMTPAATLAPGGPTPSPSFVRPTPTPLPTFLTYVVKAGDTLTSIAKAHGTTARSIAFWNRTRHPSLDPDAPDYEPDRIRIGWILQLIPGMEIEEDETFPD